MVNHPANITRAPPTPVLLCLRLIVLHGLDSFMQPKKPLSTLIANANVLPLQAVKLHT